VTEYERTFGSNNFPKFRIALQNKKVYFMCKQKEGKCHEQEIKKILRITKRLIKILQKRNLGKNTKSETEMRLQIVLFSS
jgi:hypothetical protein